MSKAELILEYARVLLSGAPIVGILVAVFLIVFRNDLRALMRRVATIRFPGGELSTTQAERASAATTEPEAAPPAPPPEPGTLPDSLSLSPDDQQRLREFLEAERARAALWEYRYLNLFLVPHTQRVLDWLANLQQRTTAQMYDSFWMPLIPDSNERAAILDALRSHHLIQLQGLMIEVTPKGKEYVKSRGPLPQSRPAP